MNALSIKVIVTDPRQIDMVDIMRERAPWAEFVTAEKEELPRLISDADVLLGRASRDALKNGHELRWMHVNSAGVDGMPTDILGEMGILLTNGRGLHRDTIGDHVMAFVLAHSRDLIHFEDLRRARKWERSGDVREVANLTMGIVGLGEIGRGVARRAKACRMRVVGTNRSGTPVEDVDETYPQKDLQQVLRVSDYLVVACPLTEETQGMIGTDELAYLPEGAFLINIARGEIVDEGALVAALRTGHLSGAGLDVFETEPLPEESPLWDIPGVLLTPHVAGRQSRAAEAGMERFLANLELYREGKPLKWQVDYERGY